MTYVKRSSGIEQVGDIPWGSHFCHLFENKQDLAEILIPYFKTGLANNELCVWVTARPLGKTEAMRLLRTSVTEYEDYYRKGQLEVKDYREWYTADGRFKPERVLRSWADKYEQALRSGFEGLRISENMFWLDQADWKNLGTFGKDADKVIGSSKILAHCVYPQKKCDAAMLLDIVSSHHFAMKKRGRRWEKIENTASNKLGGGFDHLSSFPERNPNPMMELDMQGRIVFINSRGRDVWASLVEDSKSNPLAEVWDWKPEDLYKWERKGIERELRIGQSTYLLNIIFLPREELVRVYGIDITGRQERLHETEDQLRLLAAQVPVIIWSADSDLIITSYAGGAMKNLGVEASDRIGTKIADKKMALTDARQKKVLAACMKALAGDESIYKIDTGGRNWESRVNPLRAETGEIIGIIGISHDITDIRDRDVIIERSEQQLKALSIELLNAQEMERKRLAADIHDSIGQYLAAISMRIKSAQTLVETGRAEDAAESLKELLPLVQQGVQEVRRIQSDLRPVVLDELGIIATINWYARQFRSTYPNIRITKRLELAEDSVPDLLKTIIFRVLQEAMTNAARHSGAEEIEIRFYEDNHRLDFQIADNGRGFTNDVMLERRGLTGGLGLTNMRERVQLSGGTFTILSKIDDGTTVQAVWPLASKVSQ